MTRRDILARTIIDEQITRLENTLANDFGLTEKDLTRLLARVLAERLRAEGEEVKPVFVAREDGSVAQR